MRTQREHFKVTEKVTEIEPCLAKANAEKKRLRTNVKESKTRVAALQAELQAQLDVETQVTLEIKAAKNDKRTLQKRLARAQDKAAQGTTPKSARAASLSSTRRLRRRGGRPLRGTAKCGAKCSTGTSASTGSSPR